MQKKYISRTHVCINVVLKSGKNRHVSFSALTGGGSVLYTDDEDLQYALEHHAMFGKLFREDQVPRAVRKQDPAAGDGQSPSFTKEEQSSALDEVTVTDLAAAKDYLVDKYEESRTKLKSLAQIKAAAEKHGIIFKGI